jgi:hypothetical protein
MCLSAVWFIIADIPFSTFGQESGPLQPQSANGVEIGMPEQTTDQDSDWFEEHESNGPQGSRGVPMQCLSLPQAGLAVVLLLSGAGLMALERKRAASLQSPSPHQNRDEAT